MFKLKTNRTHPWPVKLAIVDEHGKTQEGEFTAVFNIMPNSEMKERKDERALDVLLESVRDIELTDASGKVLAGAELKAAVTDDPLLSRAVLSAYYESLEKKTR